MKKLAFAPAKKRVGSYFKYLIMTKITLILTIIFSSQLFAKGVGQTVSVKFEKIELKKALKVLEEKSPYRFVYKDDVLLKWPKVTLNMEDVPLTTVLDKLLEKTTLRYQKVGNTLLVLSNAKPDDAPLRDMLQAVTVKGKVSGAAGEPLHGVTIMEKGSTNGTSSDASGNFTIDITNANAVLVFSYVGYKSLEVSVAGKTFLDVTLNEESESLKDIVVVGYGTVKKKDVTGSIISLQAKDFNKGINVAPDQLIQGKTPGVMVINNTGQPGGSTTVRIRGNSSIRAGNNPLFVLDGIPLSGGSARPGGSGGFGSDAGNPLTYLNPNDIASMDILKDASATAIYGSRGANGVVIINTKRGVSGDPTINVMTSAGISGLLRKPDVLTADEFREATKFYTPNDAASADHGDDVNAFDAITRTAFTQNHSIAMSGGTDRGRYRLSLGYLNQDGIIKSSNLQKFTANLNTNFKFLENKKLGLDINLFFTQTNEKIAAIDVGVGFEGNLISQALNWNPTRALRDDDGKLTWVSSNVINPLATLEAFKDRATVNTIIANIAPSYKITDYLEYKLAYSLTRQTGLRTGMYDRLLINPTNNEKGFAFVGNNSNTDHQLTHTLSFNKDVAEDVSLNAVAGYEYLSYDSRWYSENGNGYTNVGLDFYDYLGYSVASSRGINSNRSPKNELQSLFMRVGVNYHDRYLLTGTIRRDGSTKFGVNNKYANFPSLAFAWNLSNESFLKNKLFNNLKLRLGWGKTGNSEFPSGASRDRYVFGMQSISQANFGNPDLKWETSSTFNAGLDFGLLQNRITGSIDFFHKTTTDALFERTIAQPAPSGRIWVNLDGEVINKGVEILLSGNIVQSENWGWNITGNATFLQNSVTGLPGYYETATLRGQGFSGVVGQRMVSGQPLNVWYLAVFEGVDPSTGTSRYRSKDGHSGTDVDPAQNKFYVNSPNPKMLLGFSTDVSYKRLTATVNFNGAFGHYLFNNTMATVLGINNLSGKNISPEYFKPELKELVSNSAAPSTRYLEKGDYMKLANATISYRVGNIGKAIKNMNISLTGQNIFVLTKYKGFDPEVNTDGGTGGIPSLGIEYIPYPSARNFLLGVNFSL
ncbi:SusC/RagA family TonB-linked outer membrane protein [Terrimonas sp.]|uniref:SusC/RagA family TonB-linked outer membrane protein n=1 Tax=Terrimonas sp. TaxID=1914338 RepID=UPI001F0C3826|nr:SusC/RagA family TonB-linked outer membrane protein [Terrimonas sp.]